MFFLISRSPQHVPFVPSRVLCLVVHQLNGKLPVRISMPCRLVGGRRVVGGEQGPDSSKKVSSGEWLYNTLRMRSTW